MYNKYNDQKLRDEKRYNGVLYRMAFYEYNNMSLFSGVN
jgi:hypothetical protein